MLPDSDPRQLAWANARGLVLLRTTVPLIVVLLPLFHVFFGWLPAAPPDSLAVRLAGAGVGAVVFVLTYTSAWVRAHAAAAMVPVALALLVATAMVIVDSGNHPLYIAGGLISTFGIQLAFARTRDMVITFLGSSLFHTLYAHHQGSLQDADTPIILVLAWVSSFVSAVLGSMHIRAQTSEHAVTVALEEKGRQLELVNDRLQREQARSEELLRNVLPDVVASRLKDRSGVIADHHADVSVIFVDLVDFTKFANGRSPDEVVDLLNGIFTRFDRLAAQHGVEKIKTIGDAYMAACGVPTARADHALALARMALGVIEETERFSTEKGVRLAVRVGLSRGPVVAGVIGEKKFIYDLWGDTVNLAARMESHGLPGRIHVSESFREAVADRFRCEPRGTIEIKGKGPLPTFWLTGAA